MHTDLSSSLDGPVQSQVDVADPMEVARWSWLLDVPDVQIHHAVRLVGRGGDAVAHYIEFYGRPVGRLQH
ncbi:MAG TPA: hypothetical protein VHQ87_11595 [Rhizobacter sp.]|nr:hypothetical protein [Rhizobacter sp.]